jgi:hypothetical protein
MLNTSPNRVAHRIPLPVSAPLDMPVHTWRLTPATRAKHSHLDTEPHRDRLFSRDVDQTSPCGDTPENHPIIKIAGQNDMLINGCSV